MGNWSPFFPQNSRLYKENEAAMKRRCCSFVFLDVYVSCKANDNQREFRLNYAISTLFELYIQLLLSSFLPWLRKVISKQDTNALASKERVFNSVSITNGRGKFDNQFFRPTKHQFHVKFSLISGFVAKLSLCLSSCSS